MTRMLKSYRSILSESQVLSEKLIIFNGGKNYGQIVFMAGSPGSGKGYAISNFLDSSKFRVLNTDDLMELYLRVSPELRGLSLKDPQTTERMHELIKAKGWKMTVLQNLVNANKNPETLPNLIFDGTLDNIAKIDPQLALLDEAGYTPYNTHLVYVLTDYQITVVQNAKRHRVVADDMVLHKAENVGLTMTRVLQGKIPSRIDGSIYVIPNAAQNTVYWQGTGDRTLVKNFLYVKVKNSGGPLFPESAIKDQVFEWLQNALPRTAQTNSLFFDKVA